MRKRSLLLVSTHLTKEHGARLEDKIFGAPSFKQQAPSLTSFKLQDIIGEEREGNMTALKKKSETCEEQLRRMCKEIAEDITDENNTMKQLEAFMEGVYDIEWITFQDGTFKGARLLVAGGGPTIWVNVKTDEVEGYWAGDHCTEPFQDNLGLRAHLEQLHKESLEQLHKERK